MDFQLFQWIRAYFRSQSMFSMKFPRPDTPSERLPMLQYFVGGSPRMCSGVPPSQKLSIVRQGGVIVLEELQCGKCEICLKIPS